MGFSRQEYWSGLPFPSPVDHSFCQTCPPWPTRLGWPHRAWLSFIGLDQAVVCVIRLTSFLWLWSHCVCLLMPSWNTYRLTWVSLTLDMGYLFTAAPSKVQPLLLTLRPRGSTPHPRSGGCAGAGGLRGATPCSRSGGAAWADIPRPRPSSVSNTQWCQGRGRSSDYFLCGA